MDRSPWACRQFAIFADRNVRSCEKNDQKVKGQSTLRTAYAVKKVVFQIRSSCRRFCRFYRFWRFVESSTSVFSMTGRGSIPFAGTIFLNQLAGPGVHRVARWSHNASTSFIASREVSGTYFM
jgi:hypothetical protein